MFGESTVFRNKFLITTTPSPDHYGSRLDLSVGPTELGLVNRFCTDKNHDHYGSRLKFSDDNNEVGLVKPYCTEKNLITTDSV